MHIRFRKTFDLFPGVKLNLSRHGLSTTVGPKGMHLTFNKFGVRQSVGLPGTGLSENSYLVKNNQSSEQAAHDHASVHHGDGLGCQLPGCGCFLVLLLIAGVVVYFGAHSLGLVPANSLSGLLQALEAWVHSSGF